MKELLIKKYSLAEEGDDMSENAKLEFEGTLVELPVIKGTEGEMGLDITKLRSESGWITLDSGYMNTGSCHSAITFLDGEKGILRYRGYPIEELAAKSNFMEVSYLLLNGHLPTAKEIESFSDQINDFRELPSGLKNLVSSFPKNAHPMSVLSSSIVALSAYFPKYNQSTLGQALQNEVFSLLLGIGPLLASTFYRHSESLALNSSSQKNSEYCHYFLHSMFQEKGILDETVAKALDTLFILHADHEQNCSTSTVRLIGSSKANIFASIAGGVNALWGPLHGGANQAVIEMLENILKDGGDYKKFLAKSKDKNDSSRLMGFGHRVYKNFDPRAKIIKDSCDSVLKKLGINDPILDIAKGLEEEALKDSYFVERKLYPNVDFYSGIIYKALGIPTDMFTVMFALGRMPGWLAQWKEMLESPLKIGRPRQIYTGENKRSYIPLKNR